MLLVLFIEGGRSSFYLDELLVQGLGNFLFAQEVGLRDTVGHADGRLRGRVVENEGVVVEVDAGLAVPKGVL